MTAQKKRRSNMKCINTVDAVGHVLCHDITRIVKDVTKDTAFRKGHIVTEEDIPVLLSLGKDHLYVWEKDESMLHENEAEPRPGPTAIPWSLEYLMKSHTIRK